MLSLTYTKQVIILQCGPPSCTLLKKVSLSASEKKRILPETQLKGEFTDLF